ncbi:ABC transporter ATP-binding protein [Spongiibacter sp. KMU-158]|uniref:ABC transporter ATP-binding protein n=1 Tax=Spongiibacter pelagi TaxID=2760804 RepID=A0A927C2L4_9GAMM|nr:dipeptide/oligopeptide/nickel ABC transporter ATP-binding protein [Spongiibacter pelagi]MBD2858491.1 ABC transporter ATP-binding protein [Spongiibacter pelagi]
MTNTGSVLQARGLRCVFGRGRDQQVAVDNVDLDILPGEVVGVVGESGSGKSTLGRIITGLQSREQGELLLCGQPRKLHASSAEFRRFSGVVQMVFQDSYSSLNPRRTILDSLTEPLLLQGQSKQTAFQQGRAWLDRISLSSAAAGRYPHELSGGQRQRVGIARAFIVEPKLVVCDEAVSALDVSVQAQILALLKDIQQTQNTAMLFISHDLAVVRHMSDRVAVMYKGRRVEFDDVTRVYESPQHEYTRRLLSLHMEASL